ncbi:putative lipoprotein [Treponema pedis str. T A4]|uniref:Putative lipoprotein n=1 Tax=Treponema pedis str. T A4 TaxID=1291379 RepID=S5ZJZ9_9SPIR|nr:putative lipoprotein [Treponema pedis str. T A4]
MALGSAIDIGYYPEGNILYPDTGETPIKGSFVLKGVARHDDGIDSVSVVFQNIETKARTKTYSANMDSSSGSSVMWTVNIDNTSQGTEAGHELVKLYPIPDGEYTAIVTVTGTNGKSVEITKNYKIDNTPPVFIVDRPSTYAGLSEEPPVTDKYGAVFSIVGLAGERNTVEELSAAVPGTSVSVVQRFIGKNINTVMTSAGETNYTDFQNSVSSSSAVKAALSLSDNAREYRGSNADGKGNISEWYYLKSEIYTSVIAMGYTAEVISDYFSGKKGSNNNEHEKKILQLRSDTSALAVLKDKRIMMSDKRSAFKLDPSKSPGFRVTNVKNMEKSSFDLNLVSTALFKEGVETFVNVELIPNKDNTPLTGGSQLANYNASNIKVNLYKWNGTGDESDSLKNFIEANLVKTAILDFSTLTSTDLSNNVISVDGSNLKLKCKLPSGFSEGNYLISVEGTDVTNAESNKFVAYDDGNSANGGLFVCKYLSAGGGVRVRPVRLTDKYVRSDFDIFADVTGLGDTGKIYYDVDNQNVPQDSSKALTLEIPSGIRYKANVNIASLTDGDHKIWFKAKSSTGGTDSDYMEFVVDKTAPAIDISYPLPSEPQAGEISVSGTITDLYSGVKETGTKWIIGKRSSVPAENDTDWKDMNASTKGSWNFSVNLDSVLNPSMYGEAAGAYYKIPLYIRTEDSVGNIQVHTKEILFNPDGTKPVVRVLSPAAEAVVGGTIQIFGTASAVKGGPQAVGEVYIQFSKNGSFSNGSDCTFGTDSSSPSYTADWYQSGNGQLIPNTNTAGGAEWRIEINGNGAFNGTSQRQDVYFRLRAKNKTNNMMGEWTAPIKIVVDKEAPLITEAKIDNTSGSSSPQSYETNMWIGNGKKLTAKLTDPSGIKEVKITSAELNGGISYSLTQSNVPSGWLTPNGSNYDLSIPLDLNTMSSSAGGKFSIKVSITENTSTSLTSENTFTFRFDTVAPTGDFGEAVYIHNGNFSASSISDVQLAQKVTELGGNASSGAGAKILAGNTVLTVSSVNGNTINFTPAITSGIYNYILYKPNTLIYNGTGNWIVHGVANDDGSGIKEVEVWVSVNGSETSKTLITETDTSNRITRQLGGQCTWKGLIDLSSLSDGNGSLHYKVTDKSGNIYEPVTAAVLVKNKPIKVSSIKLSTDIGGSSVDFINNTDNNALTITADSNRDYTGTFKSKNFAFKNKQNSKITVNFTGGQGQVKYRLKKGNDTLKDLTDISSGGVIDLQSHIDAIGNSDGNPTTIKLELWDSAYGLAAGTTSAFAKIDITTLFDAVDGKKPTVTVLPFHWNGEEDNSLYENKRLNGHIEIADISGLSAGSSVSGKVSLRGFAYDNIKIEKISAVLPNSSSLTVTAQRSGNTWTSDKNMSSDGAELKVETVSADYSGYYVKWTLNWDTEKASVGTGKEIKITVNDGRNGNGDSSDTEHLPSVTPVTRSSETKAENAVFANAKQGQFVVFKNNGEKQYLTRISGTSGNTVTLENSVPTECTQAYLYDYTSNKAKATVNIVPYVTDIETQLKNADGVAKGAFSRASTGEYPVRAGETVKIKGFNLNGGNVKINNNLVSGSLDSLTIQTNQASGDLTVTVSSVESINNKVDITKPYNIEANGINNNILTARRKLFVWEMKSIIDNNFMDSPQFVMDKDSNYYMSYGSLAGTGAMSFHMMKNGTVNNTSSQMAAQYIIEQCYSKYHNTIIGYDDAGNMYGGASNTDRASSSTSFTFFSREQGSNAIGNNGNYNGGTNRRRLENNYNKLRGVYDVNRVQTPKLSVRGSGSGAKIALVYYDSNNDKLPVKFRYGTVNSADSITGGISNNVDSNGGGSDPNNSGSSQGYEVIADTTTVHKSGSYVAVALTSENRAIAVWYDAANGNLVYSYRDIGTSYNAPAMNATDRKTNEWQNNAVIIDGGAPLYVDIMLDDSNGLHIGYYSSSFGGVKYAYLPPAKVTGAKPLSSDFKIAKVDKYMNPGAYLKIGVRKENGKQVPYISYYHNGFFGSVNSVRMAWLKDGIASDNVVKDGLTDEAKFTGNWVVMTVPASSGIRQYTICQGVPLNGTYANDIIAAYFTNKNYEMAVLKR